MKHETMKAKMIKRNALLSLAAISALCLPAAAQSPNADLFKKIQTQIQEKKFTEAIAEAEQAIEKQKDLPANERVRFLKLAAEASAKSGPGGVVSAIDFNERIVDDANAPFPSRIEALSSIANFQVGQFAGVAPRMVDLSAAYATLERALKLPGLKDEDRANALKNIARLQEREGKYAEARKTYEQILASGVADRVKTDAYRLIADTHAVEGNGPEAIAIYQKHGLDLISLYQRLDLAQERYEACVKVLNDASAPEHVRWNALVKLPCFDPMSQDLAGTRQACESFLAPFLEKDPNRALFLLRKYTDLAVGNDPAYVLWASPILLKAPRLTDADYANISAAQVEALAVQGKTEEAIAAARQLAADKRVGVATQVWAQLISVVLAPEGQGRIASVLEESQAANKQEKADALIRAARTAMRMQNEPLARGLYDAYEKILAKPARGSIVCEFVKQAPFDVGSWLASPLLKAARSTASLDRPYGDNLKILLETDSAVTGRNTTANATDKAGEERTAFHIAADANGIHLFFNASDPKAAEVVAGLTGGGAFEMYLAPGEHQAYYTFLTEMPKGGIDPKAFITEYPNPQFRLPSLEEGTIRTQTEAIDGGFATYLFLDWETFYDKLPTDGVKWQFESIRWTRGGGFSFGGSESVHNRSSWGDIVFAGMTDENLRSVKRRIVTRAVARYRKAKGMNGPVGQWADPELGDVAFHQARVAPLLKELDRYALMVNKDLSDADMETIFTQAVPAWMELPHRVAAMRALYLQEKQLGRLK